MIIISQDKTTIINFDNVEFITKNDNSPYIYAKTNKAEIMIGKYKNEERALEILHDLARVYVRITIKRYELFEQCIYNARRIRRK